MRSSDVVVVGAGMAGIVAAARMLERGHRVVVLERTDQAGGYFGGFENEAGDRFDLAVSHLLGGGEGESLARLLASLDLSATVEWEPAEIADVLTIGDRRIEMPTGLNRLEERLGREFPASVDDLARFFGFLRSFLGDGSADPRDRGRFMMRHHRRGFEEFCRETISDPELRTALAMRIQCDHSSLLIMAGFLTECYGKGMVYPRGGVRRLVGTIVDRLRSAGCEFVYGALMSDVVVEGGRASGVVLADGAVRRADVVFFNGDAPTLDAMLERHGLGGIDAGGRRRGHSSLSLFHTLVGADLTRFGRAARHYLTRSTDVFETYRVLETGALPEHPVIKVHLMTNIDASIAAPAVTWCESRSTCTTTPMSTMPPSTRITPSVSRRWSPRASCPSCERAASTGAPSHRSTTPIVSGTRADRQPAGPTTSTTTWCGESVRGRASRTSSSRANGVNTGLVSHS